MLALTGLQGNRTVAWLMDRGVSIHALLVHIEELVASGSSNGASPKIGRTPNLQRALQLALHVSRQVRCGQIGTEHILLGALLASAHDNIPNGISTALSRSANIDQIRGQLAADLNFSFEAGQFPPRISPANLGISYSDPVPAAASGAAHCHVASVADAVSNGRFSGPTDGSHWVVPGVCCGISAGRFSTDELKRVVVDGGVNTFVCLQADYCEYGCTDYRKVMSSLAATDATFPPRELRFVHCPIPDFGIIEDANVLALVEELKRLMREGATLYVHCYGGHGRTGTVLVNLLQILDGSAGGVESPMEAIRLLQRCHRARGCRGCALGAGELEADEQESQASFLAPQHRRSRKLTK